MTPTKEQEEAIKVLMKLIESKSYQDQVRKNIDYGNEQFKLIEDSLKPPPEQWTQEYNI